MKTRTILIAALASFTASSAVAADKPIAADASEWASFRDTLTRYSERMKEFEGEVGEILDAQERDEREKIAAAYGAAIKQTEDSEAALRRVAIQRLEAFLQKYPRTQHTPDMLFRLSDLYFEESEVEYSARMEEYEALERQLDANPTMVLPEPPNKNYSKSIGMYRQLLRSWPDHELAPDTLYMLAWCLNSNNADQFDAEAARDVYKVIAERHASSPFANDANMQLGEYYFDQPSITQTPTAIRYYEAVLTDGPDGRNYDKAIYKLGWSHYKLNNYDRALAYLVQLLDTSDAQLLQTGKESNMRPEAVQYLAISYADIADRTGTDAVSVLRNHFRQIGDPRKWQHDVAERLAEILWVQARWEQSIAAYAFLQDNWPNHPTNPIYQQNIALIWKGSTRNAFTPPRTDLPPMPFPNEAASDAAFAQLSKKYVDGSDWANANRSNPDAIAAARKFIEDSLAQVATGQLALAQETRSVDDFREAARLLDDFLDKFPFAASYDEYEWYRAYALFESRQFPEADAAYTQILKNERSPYRDGARLQLVAARNQVVLDKYGRIDIRSPDAIVERTETSAWGKELVRYVVSDEQRAFIAACDDVLNRDFNDPEHAPNAEKDRPALAYAAANIHLEYGQIPEARERLNAIIARFPRRDEAVYAAQQIIASYSAEGDNANVEALAGRFRGMDLGESPEAKLTLKTFENAEQSAAFVIAYDKGQAGDKLGAAAAYLDFIKRFPQSEFVKDALFNAANNYDVGGKAEEAIRYFEQYIQKYPTDDRSKGLYFRIASTYSATLDLPKAISYYDQLAKNFPDHPDAPAAIFNAAFLRVGNGEHDAAARGYERYATLYATNPDAEPTFWRAGEQWEAVGEAQALDFYQRYLKRYAAQDPNHAIQAWHKQAKVFEKRKDTRRFTQAWEGIQQVFASADPARLSARSRSLAAEGALTGLEQRYQAFTQVKWGRTEAQNVEILLTKKPEELKSLTDEAVRLIQVYQDYDTAAASLYFQGLTYFAYADMVYNVPAPPGFSEDEESIWRQALDDRLRLPAEDKGRARLAAALEKSRAEKRWSTWNSKALAALNDRFPKEFPAEHAESRGKVAGGTDAFGGPVSLDPVVSTAGAGGASPAPTPAPAPAPGGTP